MKAQKRHCSNLSSLPLVFQQWCQCASPLVVLGSRDQRETLHKGMTKAQHGFPQAHTSWLPRAARRQMRITAEGNNALCKQLLKPKIWPCTSSPNKLILRDVYLERSWSRQPSTCSLTHLYFGADQHQATRRIYQAEQTIPSISTGEASAQAFTSLGTNYCPEYRPSAPSSAIFSTTLVSQLLPREVSAGIIISWGFHEDVHEKKINIKDKLRWALVWTHQDCSTKKKVEWFGVTSDPKRQSGIFRIQTWYSMRDGVVCNLQRQISVWTVVALCEGNKIRSSRWKDPKNCQLIPRAFTSTSLVKALFHQTG